jgi:hypothetical protein
VAHAGPRAGALCAGLEEPGLYAVLTSRDATSQLLLLTVGRFARCSSCMDPCA